MNAMTSVRTANLAERHHTVDELLFWLPSVLRREPNEFTRGFVVSILARSKRRGWKPTEKQLAIMRRIVSDLFTPEDDDAFEIIDREE
jgi:hypothetical protein